MAPIEATLVWFTVSAVAAPFGVELAQGLPEGWLALPVITVVGIPAAIATWLGARAVRFLWLGDRGSVVVVGRRGIRHVRRSARGRDRVFADLAWHEIGEVVASHTWVAVRTPRGQVWVAQDGTAQERQEIVESVREHLAPAGRRAPVVPGRSAYLDDAGATITQERDRRRRWSRWTGAAAALAAADAAAFAASTGMGPEVWLGASAFGAIAVGLGAATYRLARYVPRWTARPGAVVLTDRPGGPPMFTGMTLRLLDRRDSDGNVTGRLMAVDRSGAERVVLRSGGDTVRLAEAGDWLARHAGIELHDERSQLPHTGSPSPAVE